MHDTDRKADLSERTKAFALRVIRLFCALPKNTQAQVLGKQVLRSGTSVGANYREAHRARSKAEFLSKMGDCLKELDETIYWLELLSESGIVSAGKLEALRDETDNSSQSSPRSQKKQNAPFALKNSQPAKHFIIHNL